MVANPGFARDISEHGTSSMLPANTNSGLNTIASDADADGTRAEAPEATRANGIIKRTLKIDRTRGRYSVKNVRKLRSCPKCGEAFEGADEDTKQMHVQFCEGESSTIDDGDWQPAADAPASVESLALLGGARKSSHVMALPEPNQGLLSKKGAEPSRAGLGSETAWASSPRRDGGSSCTNDLGQHPAALAREDTDEASDDKEEMPRRTALEAERVADEEAARLAALEVERVAEEQAVRLAALDVTLEAERVAEDQAACLAALEAERVAKEEAARLATQEAERVAKEEAARLAALEAERVAEEEARFAALEAERVAEEEAARLAALEAERVVKEEAARLAALEAERVVKEEAARLAALEAERVAKGEAARLAEEMELEAKATIADALADKGEQRQPDPHSTEPWHRGTTTEEDAEQLSAARAAWNAQTKSPTVRLPSASQAAWHQKNGERWQWGLGGEQRATELRPLPLCDRRCVAQPMQQTLAQMLTECSACWVGTPRPFL